MWLNGSAIKPILILPHYSNRICVMQLLAEVYDSASCRAKIDENNKK